MALLLLSAVYVAFGTTMVVAFLFAGLAPAVLAIVAQAVIRVGMSPLHRPVMVALAVGAFLALTFFAVQFQLVVAAAGLVGWVLGRWWPHTVADAGSGAEDGPPPLIPDDVLYSELPSWGRTIGTLIIGLAIWLVPVLAVVLLTGRGSVFTQMGLFFSGTAVITFGGAYAVLAYVAHQADEAYGWLAPGEMVRGLALAETTPRPLIMVVQFVAFLGAYRHPGDLDPWVAAVPAW